MHKKVFANQQALDNASLQRHAQELGLNMARFAASMTSPKLAAAIDADLAQAAKLGANGTPAFFVNGVSLSGAVPFDQFKVLIDQQLAKAEALVAKGTPRAKVYDAIMKTAKTELAAAPAPPGQAPPEAGPEADQKVWKVEVGSSPSRGPKNAPLTLVIFSDYECPFCTRVEPTIKQVEKDYPGKVRVVWKDAPLPNHRNAKGAAAAAPAAGEQGKFWEMHDKLFENQRELTRPSLEQYAQQLGLDMDRFKAALDGNKFAPAIESDMKQGATLEVQGTPATFINGRKIPGAYPYETFKKIVDQELAKTGRVAARRKG